MAAYARQAKNRELEANAIEIRMRATRRLDQLRVAQKETVGLAQGRRTDLGLEKTQVKPTLAEQGIDKNLAHQARTLGAMSDEQFEEKVAEARDAVNRAVRTVFDRKNIRGTQGTSDNEWYTPAEYVDLARCVLGNIDLDPASNDQAQRTIRAKAFFSREDDGLCRDWNGHVWLNPPYAQPLIEQFADKILAELSAGHVKAAIMLTHNYTDTAWFQKLATVAAAICFTRGRIRFEAPDGSLASPTQGQAFFYFGKDVITFREAFRDVGFTR